MIQLESSPSVTSAFSAAERHESVSEKQVMEKGDGNMHDAERVSALTQQAIIPVVVVVVLAVVVVVVAIGFVVHRRTCQHKKQRLVKLPTEDSAEV